MADENGKPVEKKAKKSTGEKTNFKCEKCKSPLIHRKGKAKATGKPYDFYSCSGYPKCTETYRMGKDGKLERNEKKN